MGYKEDYEAAIAAGDSSYTATGGSNTSNVLQTILGFVTGGVSAYGDVKAQQEKSRKADEAMKMIFLLLAGLVVVKMVK